MVGLAAATLDLTELLRDLGEAADPKKVDEVVQDALVNTANQIATYMAALAPRRTGRMVNSIRVMVEPGKVTIGPTVDYAEYVEFGTGTRGEFPGQAYEIKAKPGHALKFSAGGRTIYRTRVMHPGSRPHPFVRPAAQKFLDDLGDEVGKIGAELITGPNQ